MPTKTRTAKSNPPVYNPAMAKPKRSPLPLIIGAGVVVLIGLALLAVLVFGGGSENPESVGEQQAVTVQGDGLTPYSSSAGVVDDSLGRPAPTLLGSRFDGSPLQVRPGGNPKLVVFLAHWCPACNEEVPHMVSWNNSGQVPENLEVIGVATAVDPNRANYPPSRWVQRRSWPWPVMADSPMNEAAAAYGVTGYPTSVLVGSDGTVLSRVSGVLGEEGYAAWVQQGLARDVAAAG